MDSSNKSCCVCLNSFLVLNELSKKDDNNVTLFTKIETTIPQIKWDTSFQICEPCTNLLNIVYNFRETCMKSDIIRKKRYIESLDIETDVKSEHISSAIANAVKLDFDVTKHESDNEFEDDQCSDDDDTNDPNYSEEDGKEVKVNLKLEIISETSKKKKKKANQFTCEKCQNSFGSSTSLVKHCVDDHEMNSKDVKPFACTRCSSRFGNSSNLLQHVKYHEAVRSNMCTYCGKGFITMTDLKIHEKQHLNMREYKCETCFKSYNTHKDLRSHKLVVHTDSQLWKHFCEMCHKRFPIKSNYDCHMRRHTGVKKFQCHLCNRKFTDKCVLQRHMRTHSNVRDFKCAHCEKEYKDKRVLQIHMAKVHGIGVGDIKLPSKERKYICHMCPKAYYAKNKLTRHLYTHTGEKPFFCTICEKKFNDKSYLKQHLKKSHKIIDDEDRKDIIMF